MADANNALLTNFNVDPYYDDYDQDKNFYRVLFRPGYAVQARELTQLQTILQKQVSRFGSHVFKDGSEVSGASIFNDSVLGFRLEPTYAGSNIDVTDFNGLYGRGRDSENLYRIKAVQAATGSEKDLVFAQFVRKANSSIIIPNANTGTVPFDGEVIDFSAQAPTSSGYLTANVGAAKIIAGSNTEAAVIGSSLFHVDAGVFYTKGIFASTEKQTVVIAANTDHIKAVGYTVTESLVNSDNDDTLTDPAQGAYNYLAPGADRFKLTLTLSTRDAAEIDSPPANSANFFEIARVQNGKIVKRVSDPDYNRLADVLARRTFDESGHYVVDGLNVTTANTGANSSYILTNVSKGKAYVNGYEVKTLTSKSARIPRARDTVSLTEQTMTGLYGNYIFANTINTGLFNITDKVELHANTTPVNSPDTKIGEAYIQNIEYYSGTGASRIYKIFLYNTSVTSNNFTFDATKSIIAGTPTSYSAYALVNDTSKLIINKSGRTTSGNNIIRITNPTGVKIGQEIVDSTHFPVRTQVTAINLDEITVNNNATLSNTSHDIVFNSTQLQENDLKPAYFKLPHTHVTGITNVDYKFKRKFATVTFTNGSATIQTNGGSERFSSGAGSLANENFIVVVRSGGAGTVSTGENIDLTTGSRSVTTPTPTPGAAASATIDLDEASFNGTCDIIAAIDVTADSRRVKSFANNITKTYEPMIQGTTYSLGYSDIIKINAVYEGNSSVVTSNTADANISLVTNNFLFDNGQRDAFYDHGTLKLKPGQANTTGKILVDFDYYSHGGGLGYFVADSYPNYNIIPTHRSAKGEDIPLRDVIDFRPVRTSNTSANVFITTDKDFTNHQIVDSQTFEVELDYSYYQKVTHKLMMDKSGKLHRKSGAPKLNNPPIPEDDPDMMTLATYFMNPYTYDQNDLKIVINDNSRYTMKDIGNLEKRIENVEYYTSLNLLESMVNSQQFLDDNGDTRFKSGFIADPFLGHSIGDVYNPDYKIAMDRTFGVIHPPFESDVGPFIITSSTLSSNGDYLYLPYTETSFVRNSVATSDLNINPFQVVSFAGTAKLDPTRDNWADYDNKPTITVNNDGDLDHFINLRNQAGTEYGNWRHAGSQTRLIHGDQYNNTYQEITNYTREVTTKSVRTTSRVASDTTRVLNNQFYYNMRSRRVDFELTGMRPNRDVYVFMDNINISTRAAPSSSGASSESAVKNLSVADRRITTDVNGSASGFFYVPNDAATETGTEGYGKGINIPAGTVTVLFTDNFINPRSSSTYAVAEYTSKGSKVTTQRTVVMTKDYELVTNSRSESTSDSRTWTEATGYTDPVDPPWDPPVVDPASGDGTGDGRWFLDTDATRDEAEARINARLNAVGQDPLSASELSVAHDQIYEFYTQVLNRLPDQAGYEYWVETWRYKDNEELWSGPQSEAQLLEHMKFAAYNNNEEFQNFENIGCVLEGSDPLCQTFFIDKEFFPDGIFVSSVDLFIKSKDTSGLPLRVELRPTVNGFPSATDRIPGSTITLLPGDINVPSDVTIPVKTNAPFDAPIHLLPGEYGIVLLSDSLEYLTYISTIGEKIIGGTDIVSKQPTLGSLFKSQNARTWTPQQESDICFGLNRCVFSTTESTATLSIDNDQRYKYNASSNTVGKFDLLNIQMPTYAAQQQANTKFEIKTKAEGGAVGTFEPFLPENDIYFSGPKEVTADTDLQVKLTFRTRDSAISPYIDLKSSGATLIKNVIAAKPSSGTFVAETEPSGGNAQGRYITRKITLEEGFRASALKVFLDQNMPQGAIMELYYKVISDTDDGAFEDRNWVQMTRRQTDTVVSQNKLDFNEYEYYSDNISYDVDGTTFDSFNQFAIKIVMYATSTADAPSAMNFRAIAFA